MSVNGWFPRISLDGSIASGDTSIWVDGVLLVPVGGFPQWVTRTLLYNDRAGGTVLGAVTIPGEYNELAGSEDDRWAGFVAADGGRIDEYNGTTRIRQIFGGCCPRFAPGQFAFLHPYNQDFRALIVNGVVISRGAIMTVVLGGGTMVWMIATSVHGRGLMTGADERIEIRDDEVPIAAFTAPDGQPWIVTKPGSHGIFVRPLRSAIGYWIEGDLFYPDARMVGGRLRVIGSTGQGVPLFDNWIDFSAQRVDLRTVIVDPLPPEVIGPVSDPRPHDGTVYDLKHYLLGDPVTWPRVGPTHPMHQALGPQAGLFHFVKFGDNTHLPLPYVPGEAYETWAYDDHWFYHLEDASGPPYSFTDTRWFPRRMPIGYEHGFVTGPHELVHRDRKTCAEGTRVPYDRRMWVEAIYPTFYCGRDLGVREVMVIAYDPTAGIHTPGRAMELGYYAKGAGSIRWESYHTTKVYPPGGGPPTFPESAIEARSDFYYIGGPALLPKLTGCVPQLVPSYPPWKPDPEPTTPYPAATPYRRQT